MKLLVTCTIAATMILALSTARSTKIGGIDETKEPATVTTLRSALCHSVVIGPRGFPGPVGRTGMPGTVGPPGKPGSSGPEGPMGSHGLPGDTGGKGPIGSPGSPGPKGQTGFPGKAGPKGDKGETGTMGSQGVMVVNGSKGQKGNQGLRGVAGQQGPEGAMGVKGSKGERGQGLPGATGPQGPMGTKGSKGERGAQNAAPRGPKGAVGVKGQKGEQGSTSEITKLSTEITGLTTKLQELQKKVAALGSSSTPIPKSNIWYEVNDNQSYTFGRRGNPRTTYGYTASFLLSSYGYDTSTYQFGDVVLNAKVAGDRCYDVDLLTYFGSNQIGGKVSPSEGITDLRQLSHWPIQRTVNGISFTVAVTFTPSLYFRSCTVRFTLVKFTISQRD